MPPRDPLRLQLARRLEDGAWNRTLLARPLAWAWGTAAARSLARPLVWGDEGCVIAVGGATLGGSGKTPLAIACARELARGDAGARVALVAHGYRARPGVARIVRADDDLEEVGDEALVAARALRGIASVVVAPSRQAALDRAAGLADVVILDGALQTTPRRASLALLALDAESPWGAGEVVPRGDLRATRQALLAACDGVVSLQHDGTEAAGPGASGEPGEPGAESPPSSWRARVVSRGAFVSGALVPWSSLSPLRLGLFLALARPVRLLTALGRRGIVPRRVVRVPDHGGTPARLLTSLRAYPSVDLWLASPKCSLHLEAAGVPHGVLEHTVELESPLARSLRRAGGLGPHLHAPHARSGPLSSRAP